MNIINYDKFCEKKEDIDLLKRMNTNRFLPVFPARCLFIGNTGSGKTNWAMNLLLNHEEHAKMNYSRVWLVCPDMEAKYEFLEDHLNGIRARVAKKLKIPIEDVPETFRHFKSIEDIPPLDDKLKKEKCPTIMIFDDSLLSKENNKKAAEMIIRCRKYYITIFYLTQDFFKTPKIIRSQCQYFFIWSFANARKTRSFAETFATDIEPSEFRKMYKEAVKKEFTPLLIDRITTDPKLKYRQGLYGILRD